MELLVPPRRLGRLLAQARVARGLSLDDVCEDLDGRLAPLELLEVETGRRPVSDQDLQALADLYDVETSTMVPERSVLTIDLDDGTISAGRTSTEIHDAAGRQDVLSKYLALVYSMRGEDPGGTVPLRLADLDVLAAAFDVDRRTVEDELQGLMVVTPEPVKKRFRLLRGRLLVPVVGVLVAGTAAGTLVLVPADDSSADDTQPVATVAGTPNPEVRIGDAVVQERSADGGAGPVRTRP
jgi:transcriptional regulator with XRE-family HTH domain